MPTQARLRGTFVLILLVLVLLRVSAQAADDIVALKNGDRISGTIVKMTDGKLVVKTTYAGDVTIDWKAVAWLDSPTARRTKLADGDVVSVTFAHKPTGVYLESPALGTGRLMPLDHIVAIAVPEHPSWTGSIAVNINGQSGNTDNQNFGFQGDATRETDIDRWKFSGRAVQQSTNGTTTIQQVLTRGSYDYFLSKKWFLDSFVNFEHDKLQDLTLRTRAGAGPGYWFIKTDGLQLSGLLNAAYVNENYDVEADRDFMAFALSEDLSWKLTDKHSLHQRIDLYPNVQEGSDFQAQFEIGFRQALMEGFFAELNFLDRYDNMPVSGRKKNDTLYGLSLGYQY